MSTTVVLLIVALVLAIAAGIVALARSSQTNGVPVSFALLDTAVIVGLVAGLVANT